MLHYCILLSFTCIILYCIHSPRKIDRGRVVTSMQVYPPLYTAWLPKTIDVREKTENWKQVFVVVMPKEGLVGSRQSLFGYDTNYKILLYCLHRFYSVVGVIPKEGLVGPHPTNLSLGMTTTKTFKVCFLVTHVNNMWLQVRTQLQMISMSSHNIQSYTLHGVNPVKYQQQTIRWVYRVGAVVQIKSLLLQLHSVICHLSSAPHLSNSYKHGLGCISNDFISTLARWATGHRPGLDNPAFRAPSFKLFPLSGARNKMFQNLLSDFGVFNFVFQYEIWYVAESPKTNSQYDKDMTLFKTVSRGYFLSQGWVTILGGICPYFNLV